MFFWHLQVKLTSNIYMWPQQAIACVCWFRRITVPSCVLRASNYLWIIISSDNLPLHEWTQGRQYSPSIKNVFVIIPTEPCHSDLMIIVSKAIVIFHQLFMADFRRLPFIVCHKQTRVGPTFKRTVHSNQI